MSQIQEVKEATDIVSIIGERLSLQRAGSYYKAPCPFHSERTPSFFVNEQVQRFKCYGCGEHGDVFEFLQKYEGMTFHEALEYLATAAGIQLKEQVRTAEDDTRDAILSALSLAKEYYHFLLTKHEIGESARMYLKKRGVHSSIIEQFQLGFAVDSWDGLVNYLHKKKKITKTILEKAGLVITTKEKRTYDRFRNRIIFPLKNNRGQVVGFSGRTLDEKATEAKYINSPETMVYHKSAMLFGYSEQLQEIRKSSSVIVVEGEFDVLSSVQAYVPNVVAIKGSAFTPEHAKHLSRLVKTVYLCLDADAAGVKATKQAVKVLHPYEIDVRVITLPTGKDPDELARNEPKAWRDAAKKSVSVYEFFLSNALSQFDAQKPEGKRSIMQEVAPFIGTIRHAVERQHYIEMVATALNVKIDIVSADLALYTTRSEDSAQRAVSGEPVTSVGKTGTIEKQRVQSNTTEDAQRRLEAYSLNILFQLTPEKLLREVQQLALEIYTVPEFRALVEQLVVATKTVTEKVMVKNLENSFSVRRFAQKLSTDLQQALLDVTTNPLFLSQFNETELQEEWRSIVQKLQKTSVQREVQQISARLAALDEINSLTPEEEAEQQNLLQKVVQLQSSY